MIADSERREVAARLLNCQIAAHFIDKLNGRGLISSDDWLKV